MIIGCWDTNLQAGKCVRARFDSRMRMSRLNDSSMFWRAHRDFCWSIYHELCTKRCDPQETHVNPFLVSIDRFIYAVFCISFIHFQRRFQSLHVRCLRALPSCVYRTYADTAKRVHCHSNFTMLIFRVIVDCKLSPVLLCSDTTSQPFHMQRHLVIFSDLELPEQFQCYVYMT